MLSKEERHRLAARIRLGETWKYSDATNPTYTSWVFCQPQKDDTTNVYALGVLIGVFSPARLTGASCWQDGTPYRWGGPDEILAYLERD